MTMYDQRPPVADPSAFVFGEADRLRKILEVNDVSVEGAAEMFGVSRQTIGRWINGRGKLDRRTRMAWAGAFALPVEWIETGEWPSWYTPRDLNPEPTD